MKKHRNKIFTIIGILILLGVGTWFYFYWENNHYYVTDNAKVTAELRTVSPAIGGQVIQWNVSTGSEVKENDIIGRLNNGQDLVSPINGIVAKSSVVLNQMISPTMVAAVIADTSHVYVLANVEETSITKIKVGQSVKVNLDAYAGKAFKGHISEINDVTVAALSGNATSFSTSGTYTKVVQLIPIKILIEDPISLTDLIGTNATVKIDCNSDVSAVNVSNIQKENALDNGIVAASGIVKGNNEKSIVLDFSASVKTVPVIQGQHVGLGEVLMTLDLQDIKKQILNLENSLKIEKLQLTRLKNSTANSSALETSTIQSVQANLDRAKDDFAKQEALYKQGGITNQAYEDAQKKVTDLERSLKDAHISKDTDNALSISIEKEKIASMQADLTQLKNKLNKSYIKNDAIVSELKNGVVKLVTPIPGDLITSSSKVISLTDLDSLVIEAKIPEHLINNVKIGSIAKILPVFNPEKTYSGKVTKIADMGVVINGETFVMAEIAIDNPDALIKLNFNVDVQIKK